MVAPRLTALRLLIKKSLYAMAGLFSVVLSVFVLARALPVSEVYRTRDSTVVEFRDGSTAFVFLSPDEKWRIRRELGEIDPSYVAHLIELEDRRFFDHLGVDLRALVRAIVQNVGRGRIVSGASTLTMQLVRMREPRPRTIASKLVECFRALQLESHLSKDQIITLYLTHVPFGRNIEGVEAASLAYFGHRANALSKDEIATLLAVPQNPSRRHPSLDHRERLTRARAAIAERLGFGELASPVPSRLTPFPRLAPHAARWLVERNPGRTRLRTTLDRGAQLLAEKMLFEERTHLSSLGIHNASAVVIDHRVGEVRALVGNVDFWDALHGGQNPGFDRPRSPGSALKPFIYALAIDRGLALPEHLVLDVPIQYGTYAPDNYDGAWSGLVTLEDALSRSLNVPFVNLLAELGVDRFIGELSAWGAHSLIDRPGFYGLSAAIGGVEITPLELATFYAALAEDGRMYAPSISLDEPNHTAFAAFSPGAAYLTRRALRIRDRPDFPARKSLARVPKNIHWKTGTSYGHLDAWAAGSTAAFTVVIWTGNFDNTPSVHLVGADAAGPILFDLLEALGQTGAEQTAPEDLVAIEVCALSGRLVGPGCTHRRRVLAPRKHVPIERCPYHVLVDVDDATGLALAPTCRAGRSFDTKSFVSFPATLARHLAPQFRALPGPPDLSPSCAPSLRLGPRIVAPDEGDTVMLLDGVRVEEQEVPFEAEGGGSRASWFVDGKFLGTVVMHERLWWAPTLGDHEVVVTDESGASAKTRLSVRALE